jgi:4-amino-4-deoxy-L-arabinose transferase-like glycosyltransferase
MLAPIIVGLSSPLLIYSIEFWEHTPGAALAALALAGIVKAIDSRRCALWLIASGAAIGLGLTIRAELYVYPIAIVLGLVLLRSRLPFLRSIAFLAMGGLLIAGPWWAYQAVRWGNPLGPRVAQNVPGLGGEDMLQRLGDTTGQNWTMAWPGGGSGVEWLSVLGAALIVLAVLALVFQRVRLGRALFWISALTIVAMAVILMWRLVHWQDEIGLRPDDLLTTFPVALILFLLLPSSFVRRSPEASSSSRGLVNFLLVVATSFMVLVLLVSPFQGGVQWGPRFLLPVIVPLSVVLVDVVARTWTEFDSGQSKRLQRLGLATVLGVLLGVGGYSTYLGAQFIRGGQNGSAEFQQTIEAAPEHVVVADAWFIPQGAPYTFENKIWLLAEDEKKMFQLIQNLRKQTDEPGMIYLSSLTWTHIDPQVLMGPRIAPNGDPYDFDWPGMYLRMARYYLYK